MRRIVMPAFVALAMLVGTTGCGRLSSHPVVVDAKAEVERNPRRCWQAQAERSYAARR
jgi:hypothetical protein